MILFHGTNCDFDRVQLEKSQNKRDFGRGFYTTTIRTQAIEWSEDLCVRKAEKTAYLYEFELNDEGINVKRFDSVSPEWLDFVAANRTLGGIQHSFDVVIGPIANDKTVKTIEYYLIGSFTAEQALRKLKFCSPNDQVSLHTERALKNLTLTGKTKWNV